MASRSSRTRCGSCASGKLSTTDHTLWRTAVNIENPTIILNGVVGRSTSITGPYLDQNGTDMAANGGTTVLTGAYPVNSGNCNSGANQQWVPTAADSNYRLVNVNSGKCLQISGASTTDGAVAVQSTCTAGANQQWMVV